MRKVFVLVMAMLIACVPMSFAACWFCEHADSEKYVEAASGKLGRGVANAAFGWVELFRQPAINENAWEGVGKGLVHTIGRTGSGILEVATFIIPDAKIPLPDPTCPLEMTGAVKGS
ncbi:MAG: exosortase system-associated protein, TIGR04073 family [Candidatus Omnitrophica bacterium]|nr:exosortase system-associated protein, TIGR04073 family [Candidatus Omnitrophota bacterium]